MWQKLKDRLTQSFNKAKAVIKKLTVVPKKESSKETEKEETFKPLADIGSEIPKVSETNLKHAPLASSVASPKWLLATHVKNNGEVVAVKVRENPTETHLDNVIKSFQQDPDTFKCYAEIIDPNDKQYSHMTEDDLLKKAKMEMKKLWFAEKEKGLTKETV